ncbi:putative dual specificity protein phosphatase, catalytic domain-containing protein [Neospora caninum Liverpool]|uniref:protein-tyrosine-phosphatase n=1 Tax=Neospora caninum (strain Liverpool) TaxID=572307 RepID=F0V8I6_NEOCL|nr:putative dual specificity protein phosphatase, catalytic domain-containing protein [Neospora caninum Liverpool]CBZ50027.1 putative dual specificity protein phosphatase, catalytic domain-containing protein [Neospora caninum Liverpool]CEL64617.1 TPA: dual specificity protein phosphatase, catalytic domain-containing protein, putative [Neospora caninum Liverpool]|eukprot:XP_003880062.1 putative dual specificity protein phosphatase, catalytic domain-containing protein [Neospora caninum Liverpool]
MAPSPPRVARTSVYPPLDFSSLSWIFIGDKDLAKNLPLLRQRHISYIINCTPEVASGGVPNYHVHSRHAALGLSRASSAGRLSPPHGDANPGGAFPLRPLEYHRLDMVDNATEKLSRHFERFWALMERVRIRESGNVLVHCNQGVSRSVAMVSSYLIRFFKMTADDAVALIQINRPVAKPNDAFMRQLRELDAELRASGAYPPNAVAFSLADARHDQESLLAHERHLASCRRAFAAMESAQAVAAASNRRVIGPARPQAGPEWDRSPPRGGVVGPALPPHLQTRGDSGGAAEEVGGATKKASNGLEKAEGDGGEEEKEKERDTGDASGERTEGVAIGPQFPAQVGRDEERRGNSGDENAEKSLEASGSHEGEAFSRRDKDAEEAGESARQLRSHRSLPEQREASGAGSQCDGVAGSCAAEAERGKVTEAVPGGEAATGRHDFSGEPAGGGEKDGKAEREDKAAQEQRRARGWPVEEREHRTLNGSRSEAGVDLGGGEDARERGDEDTVRTEEDGEKGEQKRGSRDDMQTDRVRGRGRDFQGASVKGDSVHSTRSRSPSVATASRSSRSPSFHRPPNSDLRARLKTPWVPPPLSGTLSSKRRDSCSPSSTASSSASRISDGRASKETHGRCESVGPSRPSAAFSSRAPESAVASCAPPPLRWRRETERSRSRGSSPSCRRPLGSETSRDIADQKDRTASSWSSRSASDDEVAFVGERKPSPSGGGAARGPSDRVSVDSEGERRRKAARLRSPVSVDSRSQSAERSDKCMYASPSSSPSPDRYARGQSRPEARRRSRGEHERDGHPFLERSYRSGSSASSRTSSPGAWGRRGASPVRHGGGERARRRRSSFHSGSDDDLPTRNGQRNGTPSQQWKAFRRGADSPRSAYRREKSCSSERGDRYSGVAAGRSWTPRSGCGDARPVRSEAERKGKYPHRVAQDVDSSRESRSRSASRSFSGERRRRRAAAGARYCDSPRRPVWRRGGKVCGQRV